MCRLVFSFHLSHGLYSACGLCTYLHISNQHYSDRIYKTAYHQMHRNCSALYFVILLANILDDRFNATAGGNVCEVTLRWSHTLVIPINVLSGKTPLSSKKQSFSQIPICDNLYLTPDSVFPGQFHADGNHRDLL